jgi:heterodisulfide reductase subunit C
MEKLRRLDHKLDEIKKVESRVMSNGSKMESLERSLSRSRIGSNLDKHTNSQSELQKHEEAMKLIRKLNEERKEREDKKNRKAEEMMKVQQAEIEALLLAKAR